MTDDGDFTSYVAARWTHLVRSLVALGLPLGVAETCAADALSRCHDDWDERDGWADLDVHVARELFEAWERRRDPWWERPVPVEESEALADGGWSAVEPVLDRMPEAERRGLVLREVAGLGAEQAREVTGVEPPHADPAVVGDLRAVLDALPVDPPHVEAMISSSRSRLRRRRTVSLGAALALVLIGGGIAALVLDDRERGGGGSTDLAPVDSVRQFNASPIAFYADGSLFLPRAKVELQDVRQLAEWNGGAVYLDVSGNLATVTEDGERRLIEALGPEGSFAVSDFQERLVWIDPDGPELVDYDLAAGERVLEVPLPAAATMTLLEGNRAYFTTDEGYFLVELADGAVRRATDWRLPGELDRNGRFVLTRESGWAIGSRVRLIDTATGRPVPLRLAEPTAVSAAGFAPDGAVILLVEPAGASISEVRRCAAPYDYCPRIAFFTSGGARAVLAR